VEVSTGVTFPGQISSSIFFGILHWAKSVGGFTPSRYRQNPTGSSPEAGPQDLSLLWSYDHVSLCCFRFGNFAFVAVWFPYSDHILLSLCLCLCYMTVDAFVCSPLLSCSKSTCLPPQALTVKSWIARIFLLIQLYITLFLNSRNFSYLQLLSAEQPCFLALLGNAHDNRSHLRNKLASALGVQSPWSPCLKLT